MLIAMIRRRVYPYSTGGAEVHTYYAVKELAKRNRLILISEGEIPLKIQGCFNHLNIKPKFKHAHLLSSMSFILLALIFLFSKVRRVDVLHAQGALSSTIVGLLAKKALKAPLVVTCHGSEVRLQKSKFIRGLQKLAFLSADEITTVSNEIKGILASRYQVDPSKISVVPNGYDEEFTRKYLKNNENADVSKDVVYVGRLSYPKDPVTLLYAFERVHKVLPSISLCFVGDGGLRPPLEQFCRDHGLSKAVRFLGKLPHDEALKFIAQSTVFVLSSYEEGLPTVLIEAMALRKPVIAAAVGGIPEVVKDGINGVLVPPKSPEHVAKALERLLTDLELRRKLGEAAAESVKDYTWSKIAEKYEEIYEVAVSLQKKEKALKVLSRAKIMDYYHEQIL